MTILEVTLDAPLLTPADEAELARRIEAGLYADRLLAGDVPPTAHDCGPEELAAVSSRGREAWQRMWLANLRLVMLLAADRARRHQLPVDELFQDGCLALALALQRFDVARGLRFTTLAHEFVRRALAVSAAGRCGTAEGPPHRRRVLQQVRRVDADEDSPRQLARAAGVTLEAAVLCRVRHVSLDHAPAAAIAEDGHFDRVHRVGPGFLGLLQPLHATFLRLRFGLGGPAQNLKQIGRGLRMKPPQVRELESAALAEARIVLGGEQCLHPAVAGRTG